MEVLGGADTVQPITGIVLSIPYDDYQYTYSNGYAATTKVAPTRKEYKYTITLEEAEKIQTELNAAIHASHKIRDFFDL